MRFEARPFTHRQAGKPQMAHEATTLMWLWVALAGFTSQDLPLGIRHQLRRGSTLTRLLGPGPVRCRDPSTHRQSAQFIPPADREGAVACFQKPQPHVKVPG